MSIYKFPDNFKWGSATSAHQVEGGNHNDWTEWENSPARIEQLKKEGKDPADFVSGKACDSYSRYEEDFDIAKKLNQNIHRFSIEWSRIEPEEGKFNEKEIQHYVNIVKSLKNRGIEPMITLWHFTNPVWFAKKGGWLNSKSPDLYARFIKVVVGALKGENVRLWITFNEATTVYGYYAHIKGLWPPHYKSLFKWRRANKNIIRAHIAAYKEIKKIYDDNHSPVDIDNKNSSNDSNPSKSLIEGDMSHNVVVGIAEGMAFPVSGNSFYQKIIGKLYNYYRNLYFLTKAFPYYDFIGVNYYKIDRLPGSEKNLPKQEVMLEKGWEIYPQGIYHVLKMLQKFKKPIFITENGIADSTDQKREKFIKDHLYWIYKAIKDSVDVRGYLYWSLLDNFEIIDGYKARFGLVEIDYRTFERRIRPSAYEYAKICKDNRLESD